MNTPTRRQLQRNVPRTLCLSFLQVFMLLMPVIVIFFESRGLALADVLLLQAWFAVLVGVLEVPSGYIADLLGRRGTMIVGGLFLGIGHTWLVFAHGFWPLAAFEASLAVAFSLISGADLALLYDTELALAENGEHKEKAVRRLFFARNLSEALAAVLCSVLLLVVSMDDIAIAQAALHRLALDRVILIPAGRPWLKSDQQVTAPEHRLSMARLAVQDIPKLEVSPIEIDRPGPTYTIDTLIELRENLGSQTDLYLVLGMDSIRELPRWRDPNRLFDLCTIVAVSRPDTPDVTPTEIQRSFPATPDNAIITIRGPMLHISATHVRQRVANRQPISHTVPPPVQRYIQEHRLYIPPPP